MCVRVFDERERAEEHERLDDWCSKLTQEVWVEPVLETRVPEEERLKREPLVY